MQFVELNPVGNFDPWEQEKIDELLHQEIKGSLSNRLVFENEVIKLWDLRLLPGERLNFRRHNTNYGWVCTTGGLVITRYGNGKIDMVKLNPGDTEYFENRGKNYVNDLENIGEDTLVINILEYKESKTENRYQFST
ncbi:hypothetical protein D2V08_11445 [Flagellimonas lutimaris]|uniref:Cupin domain-containing protein n=1 Tax=Flagellimonas lutimaris TaxID=475082 RepID=A0A3A1N8K3_9FLAO|nr:hypothetical protein [Allomuricauda lutimaris]RIV33017.1 hypothetical protein D2V08_11445 [Allomuricauda lutimaris]|tara:strand:- start:390 stop:800 length:411 start_codon:yes stop_codon:yes gene_type:complete